jgi:hypothetical protein
MEINGMQIEVSKVNGMWLNGHVKDVLLLEEPSATGVVEGNSTEPSGDKLEVSYSSYVNGQTVTQTELFTLDKCRRPPPPSQKDEALEVFTVGQSIDVYLTQANGSIGCWQLAKVTEVKVKHTFVSKTLTNNGIVEKLLISFRNK